MRLFCARHRVLWSQASSDRWRLRKSSILLFLVWLSGCSSTSWRGPNALRVLSTLFAVKPAYVLPSHTHTASSDIKKVLVLDQLQAPPCHWLRTIWKSRAAQAFATTIDWRSTLQSQINAQVRQATFWDTHKSSCSGELRQATDRFALVDEEIIEVVTVYEKAREVSVCRWQWCCGHYSGRGCRKNTSSRFEIRPIGPAWSSDSTVKPQC